MAEPTNLTYTKKNTNREIGLKNLPPARIHLLVGKMQSPKPPGSQVPPSPQCIRNMHRNPTRTRLQLSSFSFKNLNTGHIKFHHSCFSGSLFSDLLTGKNFSQTSQKLFKDFYILYTHFLRNVFNSRWVWMPSPSFGGSSKTFQKLFKEFSKTFQKLFLKIKENGEFR